MTVRRLKSYTGETGCVFQYYFVGKRPALAGDPFAPATEFVFDVIADARPTFAISIFLGKAAVDDWQDRHGRKLVEAEQYAAAKMELFRAFDELANLREGRRLLIASNVLEVLLAKVGVD